MGGSMASSRRTVAAYRRTALVGLASTVALVWGLGPAAGQGAQDPAGGFSNGMAKATAVVTKIAPGVGSLELALANGIAVAELKNRLAQAQAQSLDLGLIGTTLTAEGCRDAALTADELPQPTRVDNRNGDAAASSDEVPLADSTLGGGRESARATATSAEAVATSASSVGPVLEVAGGRAEAATQVIDGAAREARASVGLDLTIAGTVTLGGLRWVAVHRTGRDPLATASFDVGTAEVLGVPLPLESLAAVEAAINTVLEQTGISIEMPRVERFEEPTDLVRVTPMRIVLKDSPAGKTILGPALDLTREQRFNLFNDLAGAICDAAGLLLVGDIGVSIASGTGFLAVELGGAEAISGELVAGNPFGPPTAPQGPAEPPAATPGVAPPPVIGGVPTTPPAAAPPAERPERVADVGPLEQLCETIHPFRSPSCSEGAMAPLGALGLAATVAVGALDWRHQRRRLAAASPVSAA